jgi:hypothetical protein
MMEFQTLRPLISSSARRPSENFWSHLCCYVVSFEHLEYVIKFTPQHRRHASFLWVFEKVSLRTFSWEILSLIYLNILEIYIILLQHTHTHKTKYIYIIGLAEPYKIQNNYSAHFSEINQNMKRRSWNSEVILLSWKLYFTKKIF